MPRSIVAQSSAAATSYLGRGWLVLAAAQAQGGSAEPTACSAGPASSAEICAAAEV